MWHVTRDTWHSSLAHTVCDLGYYEDLEEKAHSLSDWLSNEAVCRTAPATPGLLTSLHFILRESAGRGSLAVAVGFSNRWHMKHNRWHTDFLKVIFCAAKISAQKFCANKMVQNNNTKIKKLPKTGFKKLHKLFIFAFKNPNLAESLKFFARPYGCTF